MTIIHSIGSYSHPLDPSIVRRHEPIFYHEKIIGVLFEGDNAWTCVISYWLSEDEIQGIVVSCLDKPYSDFDYDVKESIYSHHGRIEITGEIEKHHI